MIPIPPPADGPVTVRRGEPEQGYRIPPPPVDVDAELGVFTLTAAQLDGTACVACGCTDTPMRPVTTLGGVQLVACITHPAAHALIRVHHVQGGVASAAHGVHATWQAARTTAEVLAGREYEATTLFTWGFVPGGPDRLVAHPPFGERDETGYQVHPWAALATPKPADGPVTVRQGEHEPGFHIPPPPVSFQEPELHMGHTDTSDLLTPDEPQDGHMGNDPMGAPTTHKGSKDNCPAPDCGPETADRPKSGLMTQESLDAIRRMYAGPTIGRRTVYELLDEIERLHIERVSAPVDWSQWFPAEPDAVFETNIQTAVNAAVAAERARVEQLVHHRAATVKYGTNWDQAHGYAQGLADAVGLMYHHQHALDSLLADAGIPPDQPAPSAEPDPWACDACGAAFGPTRLPVARLGHNGARHLLACMDCTPEQQSEPAVVVAGVEYHWMLCYIVPRADRGADYRQKSGVITLTNGTRAQAFGELGARVAVEDGITAADFAVTFFSLEPNALAPDVERVLAAEPAPFIPRRGDDVEAWLEAWFDRYETASFTYVIGRLLGDHHAHADAGIPLDQPLPPTGTDPAEDV